MLLLFLKLELLEISRNYVTLVLRITQLSPLLPNHQQDEHYFTLQITCLITTCVEIISPKKSNIIVGVIYRHPSMDVTDFNQIYLNGLLDKISKEEKNIFLLCDFNIDLLNYNEHRPTNDSTYWSLQDPY